MKGCDGWPFTPIPPRLLPPLYTNGSSLPLVFVVVNDLKKKNLEKEEISSNYEVANSNTRVAASSATT